MRIRIIKPYENYRKGDIVYLSQAQAKLLIKGGIAVISKDMTPEDLKVKHV